MKFIPLFLLFSLTLISCEDEVEILKIERAGLLRLTVNNQEWVANEFKLNTGPLVVVTLDSNTLGRSFRRYALIGQGVEPTGRRFQVSYIFDLSDQENFVGTYNRNYTFEKGGLNEVTLNLESAPGSNYYAAYVSNKSGTAYSELKINKQSRTERLVLGTFQSNMVLKVDTTQTLNIQSGVFEDVNY